MKLLEQLVKDELSARAIDDQNDQSAPKGPPLALGPQESTVPLGIAQSSISILGGTRSSILIEEIEAPSFDDPAIARLVQEARARLDIQDAEVRAEAEYRRRAQAQEQPEPEIPKDIATQLFAP